MPAQLLASQRPRGSGQSVAIGTAFATALQATVRTVTEIWSRHDSDVHCAWHRRERHIHCGANNGLTVTATTNASGVATAADVHCEYDCGRTVQCDRDIRCGDVREL